MWAFSPLKNELHFNLHLPADDADEKRAGIELGPVFVKISAVADAKSPVMNPAAYHVVVDYTAR